jgi:hypothetical protein
LAQEPGVKFGRRSDGNMRLALLVAAALLIKVLVPAGWMPTFDNGTLMLKLCGGWAPVPADHPAVELQRHLGLAHGASPARDHDRHDGAQQGWDQACSFAAAGLLWNNADDGRSLAQPAPLFSAPLFPSAVAVGSGLAAPPPPSTGPPPLS